MRIQLNKLLMRSLLYGVCIAFTENTQRHKYVEFHHPCRRQRENKQNTKLETPSHCKLSTKPSISASSKQAFALLNFQIKAYVLVKEIAKILNIFLYIFGCIKKFQEKAKPFIVDELSLNKLREKIR